MGPLSGRRRLCGNDQQCLAAPIWKYRSGFGDHRFTFFIDLFPNYTFYTNLTNIVHWVVAYRDVAHLMTLNLGKVEKKYAKSFDAGLTSSCGGLSIHFGLISIGSSNGLFPHDSKPLPEPMMTNHQCGPATFVWRQFHKRCISHNLLKLVGRYLSKISFKLLRRQWVNALTACCFVVFFISRISP